MNNTKFFEKQVILSNRTAEKMSRSKHGWNENISGKNLIRED